MFKKEFLSYVAVGFLSLLLYFHVGCNPNGNGNGDPDNPVPVLSGISPDAKVAHLPSFTLTATGSDFVQGVKIVFNGVEKNTTFISSTEISCTIEPDDIAASSASPALGTASSHSAATIPVLVRNPSPGGGDSTSLNFTIYDDFVFTVSQALPMGALPVDDPVMTVDGDGNVSVLYRSNAGANENETMAFIRSADGGCSWSAPVTVVGADPERISGFGVSFLSADISGNLHAMILEDYVHHDVNYCYSTDNGATWSTPSYVAFDLYGHTIGRLMVVDSFGGINFIIMKQDVEGHSPVWFKRSTDFGASFDIFADIWIDWEVVYDSTWAPALAVDDNHGIFATFSCTAYTNGAGYNAIFYNYSHDSGTTWNTVDTVIGPGEWSALTVVPNGDVHIFVLPEFFDDVNNHIIHYHSKDRGVSWGSGVNITNPGSGESKICAATDAAGNINLLYNKGNGYYFRRSVDNGVTWLDEILVFNDTTGLARGKIKTDDSGNVFFIFYNDVNISSNVDYGPVYLVKGQ